MFIGLRGGLMGIKLPRDLRDSFFISINLSGGRVLDNHDSEGIFGDGGGIRDATASTHLVRGASTEDDDVVVEGP
jgi:hypothetical protein